MHYAQTVIEIFFLLLLIAYLSTVVTELFAVELTPSVINAPFLPLISPVFLPPLPVFRAGNLFLSCSLALALALYLSLSSF